MRDSLKILKSYLADPAGLNQDGWYDWDGVMYSLGRDLEVFDESTPFQDVKWVFWSANDLGEALFKFADDLCKLGILECRDNCEYRWVNETS